MSPGSDELRVELDENAPPVNVGDNVVTSGIEQSDFPEGLSVGAGHRRSNRGQAGLGTVVRVKPWTGFGGARVRDGAQVGAGSRSGHDHHDDHDDHDDDVPRSRTTTTAPTTAGGSEGDN